MLLRRRIATVLSAALAISSAFAVAQSRAAEPQRVVSPITAATGTAAASSSSLYPPVGAGTHLIDPATKLAGFNEPAWYEANIPFLDVPDQQINDVYYYRWRTYKEHLRYTNPTSGWISTEFLDCCGYAAPYQGINAAAGFQITESQWLRNQSYGDDDVAFWLTGPGQTPQTVNPDASDWAHEYSFWAATAVLHRAQATGNVTALKQVQSALVKQYRNWDNHFDAGLGLYWQLPVWDAKEFSPASYESSQHFGGVHTFRPSINAYQYGDALAIAEVARLNHDTATQRDYQARAAALKANAHKWLWDPSRKFFYDIVDENNPTHAKLDTREEAGFVPWQFGLADPSDSSAWQQILDPQGFASAYGPTTVERRSHWFMSEARQGCCHWDGPSWPFSTAQELTGLANLLDDYPAQTDISKGDYVNLLHTFAATQYRNGKPYVAEAHDPDQPNWIYDGFNHSEDYNHSSYDDLVISGLIGLRPSLGNTLTIKPLAPSTWDHFALENVPYHGHNVTVAYDRDGSHYHAGTGLQVFVDGRKVRSSATVATLTIDVGATKPAAPGFGSTGSAGGDRTVNDAANPLRTGYPQPIASFTGVNDNAWNPLDGKVWYNEVPQNTRWTNYGSTNAQDYYGVDFGTPTPVGDVRFYGYDDGGGVKTAASYQLQYDTGTGWADVPGQARSPAQPVGNGLNRITFPALTTNKIRLLFTAQTGSHVGVTELQAWSASSADVSLAVSPIGPDQTVLVDGPTKVTVTATDRTPLPLLKPSVSIAVPAGWTVTPSTASGPLALFPGRPQGFTFTVTPPAGARGVVSDLVATARYTAVGEPPRSTHIRQALTVSCHEADSRVPGRIGSALQLCGGGQYVSLPTGIVSGLNDVTVSAWVKPAALSQWSRVFDFGTNNNNYMFLSVSSGTGPRFAITTSGGDNEQRLDSSTPLPLNTWSHLAVTLSGTTATMYVNGTAVATNNAVTLNPGDLGATTNNWLGKSQYSSDPYLDGVIDDVQIYDHALSAADLQSLATGTPGAGNVASYRFDESGGATAVDSSPNHRDGTIH